MKQNKKGGESGLAVVIGTIEEGKKMIGTTSESVTAEFPVNEAMIQYYCAAVEDANPAYWDRNFAKQQWDGITCPPGMLQSWIIPLPWRPDGAHPITSLALSVPLPGSSPINISTELEYFEPIRVGDRITYVDKLVDISDEKSNRLGTGHFVTTEGDFTNQNETLLARSTNVIFRFTPHEARS